MKRLLVLLIIISASVLRAETPKVEAIIAKDKDSKPDTRFLTDGPILYTFFRSQGTHAGDKLRGVWIADDVGSAAEKETTIDDATLTADSDNFYGAFSITKPTKGWPVGKYHIDIYLNDNLTTSVKFVISATAGNGDEAEQQTTKEDDQ